MRILFSILAMANLFLASPLLAERFKNELIVAEGAWTTVATRNTENDSLKCVASTTNADEQSFSLAAYDTGNVAIFVIDRSWSLAPRPIKILIDVDQARWEVAANATDIRVIAPLNGNKSYPGLIKQLTNANSVSISNKDGENVAKFSLSGSAAAISGLFGCWNHIGGVDPANRTFNDQFGKPTDPFN